MPSLSREGLIADLEQLRNVLDRCNSQLTGPNTNFDNDKVAAKAYRTAIKICATEEQLKTIRNQLDKLQKEWDMLQTKQKLLNMYESTLKEPYSIGISHWEQAASGVDVVALFGPFYPEKDWPEEVPYCHMVELARYLDQRKRKQQLGTEGNRGGNGGCEVCGGSFVGLRHIHRTIRSDDGLDYDGGVEGDSSA